jgi:hypothetical protein
LHDQKFWKPDSLHRKAGGTGDGSGRMSRELIMCMIQILGRCISDSGNIVIRCAEDDSTDSQRQHIILIFASTVTVLLVLDCVCKIFQDLLRKGPWSSVALYAVY